MALALNLVIDVSGQPYETMYFGLISIKTYDVDKIIKKFKKKYPNFYRSKQKGSKRNPGELKTIIDFLNENGVHMFSLCFKSEEWINFLKQYKNRGNFNERVMGLLYILLLEGVCRKYKTYQITFDTETFIDINKALDVVRRIAKANNYYFNLSTARSKTNELIRFADYVASAHRKVKRKDLDTYKLFKIIGYRINKDYINKAFK